MIIGAGTVTTVQQVSQVCDAGAQFVVSPNTNERVVLETCRRGMASFPGAFTCTEVMKAFDVGAHAVKVFPMVDASPRLIKALIAPLGEVLLIPTGGISARNASSYVASGAFALGIGSELVSPKILKPNGLKSLYKTATELTRLLKEYQAR